MIGLFLSFLLYLLFTNNSILHADKFKDEKNMTNDVTDSFSSLEENLPVASGVRREVFAVLYLFKGAMGRMQSIGRHELHCA